MKVCGALAVVAMWSISISTLGPPVAAATIARQGAAPVRKPVVKNAPAKRPLAKPAPKLSATDRLAAGLALNLLPASANLWKTCLNSNVKALAWGLEAAKNLIDLQKSEFETQVEFQQRQDKLTGALNGQGQLVVCQDLSNNDDAPFRYDAEKEKFGGSFEYKLLADLDFKKVGAYQTKTRMGVPVTVESFVEIDYKVDMSAAFIGTSRCLKTGYSRVDYEVAVPRTEAPGIKANSYLAFVGSLAAPYFSKSEIPGEPTLDHPKDIHETHLTVYFKPAYFAIVTQDGKEVFRCDL